MPEGDSYTRAADRIRPVLVGRAISSVDGVPVVRRHAGRLVGSSVTGVRTHGKHLLFDSDSGLTIHVWLGMSGSLRVEGGGNAQAIEMDRRSRRGRLDRGAMRLAIGSDRGTVVVLAAPTVEVERTRVVNASLARLGSDVLADEFDWDLFRSRARLAPDDMIVADFLLDQRVMAGVGNEYKNEILFLEGLHPETPLGLVDSSGRDDLAVRARRLMLPNALRAARNTTGVRGASTGSWVFERTGRPCRRCRTAIVSARIGAHHPRVTYWCPVCQAPESESPSASSRSHR